jgi:hypothetical protein
MKVIECSQFLFQNYVGTSFSELEKKVPFTMTLFSHNIEDQTGPDKGMVFLVEDVNGNCKLFKTNFDSSD